VRPVIGFIGGGRMATTHSKCAHFLFKRGLIDGEIAGVCETDAARLAAFAAASRARLATADPNEIIADPAINTVYICTPTFNHRELAEEALAAGKAVFCEKPLAFHAEDAQSMTDAAARAGVTHQVGLVMRFSAVMNVTKAMMDAPDAGRPMTASLVDDQFFPIQGHYDSTWRGDPSMAGAGTLLEHAIHDVDVLAWFFGPVKRVFGTTRHFAGNDRIEDLSNAIIEFESGAVANHASIWHNILHRGSSRQLTVTCENARYHWDQSDWSGPIHADRHARGGPDEITADDVVRRYADIVRVREPAIAELMSAGYAGQDYLMENYAFLLAVSEDRPAFPDFATATYAHRIVDAIYESARSGGPVDVK
jgi:predicted dehydrogenase